MMNFIPNNLVGDSPGKHEGQAHRHRKEEMLDLFHAPCDEQSVNQFVFGVFLALLAPAVPQHCVAPPSQSGRNMAAPSDACTDGTANAYRHEHVCNAQGGSRRNSKCRLGRARAVVPPLRRIQRVAPSKISDRIPAVIVVAQSLVGPNLRSV
eukprot:gnl/TRDRNA2_/TRDRNA2_177439_c1_seq2.p2 gnl/TRDRNA2_/TRDRNA2_177439_c1~~gnl/TRDRNA2_/TRDRNA2_177439_c1_seq2.p2  ORF type:complete len:152 (+),score=8.54 gnl/TRDRNA2_/TRDRNA2_177439_c1_seq2:254-709(+)